LLALGEFSTLDNFGDNEQGKLACLFFIGATFISQLTILNMLIAVMGDTYERVIENKEVNATQTKLAIMDDLTAILPQESSEQAQELYLFLAIPALEEDDEGESWEGSLKRMTRLVERNTQALTSRLDKKTNALQDSIEEMSKKEIIQYRNMKAHLDNSMKIQSEKISRRVDNVRTEVQTINTKVDSVFGEIRSEFNAAREEIRECLSTIKLLGAE